ncbi:DIO1, partial [Symbiodinium microadriaticum]
HAVDGWYLPTDKKPIYNHKTLSDRIAAAKQLQTDYNFPGEVVCDSMKNEAAWRYLAMPERLFIIQDGFIVYHGGKGPFHYMFGEVEEFFGKRFGDGDTHDTSRVKS